MKNQPILIIYAFAAFIECVSINRLHAQNICFTNPVNYFADYTPLVIVPDDFNKDGIVDLACANKKSNQGSNVSVFIGKGDGTFSPAVNYLTNGGNESVTSGDFDKDGYSDLAVTNYNSHTISILLNHGNGTFDTAKNLPYGNFPASIVATDFNNDGNSDLVWINEGDASVNLLPGNGNGTFGDTLLLKTPDGTPLCIKVSDLNGDSAIDILVSSYIPSNSISIFIGHGDGSFEPRTDYRVEGSMFRYPGQFTVADLNKDGKQDLAVCHPAFGVDTVSIWLGKGDGTFNSPSFFRMVGGPASIAATDFNKDGNEDIVVADYDPNSISVLSGNGDGAFGMKQSYSTGVNPTCVATADFNGDTLPDITVVNSGTNTDDGDLSVLINCLTTGFLVDEQLTSNALLYLYPNPFTDYTELTISSSFPIQNDTNISLYDLYGRIAADIPVSNNKTKIYRNNLPAGIYLIVLSANKETACTAKLIIQ